MQARHAHVESVTTSAIILPAGSRSDPTGANHDVHKVTVPSTKHRLLVAGQADRAASERYRHAGGTSWSDGVTVSLEGMGAWRSVVPRQDLGLRSELWNGPEPGAS